MRLWIAFGYAIWYSASRRDQLESAFTRALELANQVGDVSARLHARWGMWAIRRAGGKYREALAFADDYAALARTVGTVLVGGAAWGRMFLFLPPNGGQGVAAGSPGPHGLSMA
jgi:hypothetical protein